MLADLMQFTALFNAVCIMLIYFNFYAIDFCIVIYANVFCFVIGMLTHSLFISIIVLHYVHAFNQLVFLFLCSHRFCL